MKTKKFLSSALVLVMTSVLAGPGLTVFAENGNISQDYSQDSGILIEINSGLDEDDIVFDGEEYELEIQGESKEHYFEQTDNPYDFVDEDARMELLEDAQSFPDVFDLRDVDGRCYVTSVKLQNPFGTCWGFSAVSAAESSILSSLLKDDPDAYKKLDLSEKQLAYFSHKYIDDPENSQNGEGMYNNSENYTMFDIYGGGTPFLAASTFSQGIGPVNESRDDIFIYKGDNGFTEQSFIDGEFKNFSYSMYDNWVIPEEYRFNQDYILSESYSLPSPANKDASNNYTYNEAGTAAIKEQLADNNRAVTIGFCADVSSPNQTQGEDGIYLSTKNWAHYTWNASEKPNHAVTIIGWDDAYPKENFVEGHQPPGNGAWLVKNSWGSGEEAFPNYGIGNWGLKQGQDKAPYQPVSDINTGYFWISYYDTSIAMAEAMAFDEYKETSSYYLDEYDLMQVSDMNTSTSDSITRMANVFKAEGCERLKAVSFQTTTPGTKVTCDIYLLESSYESPEDGLNVAHLEPEAYEYGGFHKLYLDTPVLIQKGQAYSIVVEELLPDGKYCVTAPISYGKDSAVSKLYGNYQVGIVNEGESLIWMDDKWQDYSDRDVQLKASGVSTIMDPYWKYQFDNFPIKGFSNIEDNISMLVADPGKIYLYTGYDKTKVTLRFAGDAAKLMGNPSISWSLDKGGEELVDMVVSSGKNSASITAKKAGKTRIILTVDGVGTSVIPVYVGYLCPKIVILGSKTEEYTGAPIETSVVVSSSAETMLTEHTDYEKEFVNNIKCGAAALKVTGINEAVNQDDPSPIFGYFAIVPQAGEIKSITAADYSADIYVADQKESGITGYRAAWREKGTEEWNIQTFSPDSADLKITGLNPEKEYEVKTCAYTDMPQEAQDYGLEAYYEGGYSDIRTFSTVPEILNAALAGTSFAYTGKDIKPQVTVTNRNGLVIGSDNYTVTYTNNRNAGEATATVTYKGDNYKGSSKLSFKIIKAKNSLSKVTSAKVLKFNNLKKRNQTFKISAEAGDKAKLTFKLASVPGKAKKYIKVRKAGSVIVKKGLKKGSYAIKVRITAQATENYLKTTMTKTIKLRVK